MTPVFKNQEEVAKTCSFFTTGAYISEENAAEAGVEQPGWYLIRTDLARLLPVKYCIVKTLPDYTLTQEEMDRNAEEMSKLPLPEA